MIKCNNCGLELDDGTELCPNCGNDLNSQERDESDKCPNCGTVIGENDFVCPSCGSKVAELRIIRKCPFCGETLDDDALVCTNCGKHLSTSNQIQEINESLVDSSKTLMEKLKGLLKSIGDFFGNILDSFNGD